MNNKFLINGKKVSDKEQSYVKSCVNIMFTKIYANKGIKEFVQKYIAEMFKKFKKLGEGAFPVKPVVESTCPSMITQQDKEKLI